MESRTAGAIQVGAQALLDEDRQRLGLARIELSQCGMREMYEDQSRIVIEALAMWHPA